MAEEANKVGRPSEYDPGIAALICKGVVEGKGLRRICEPQGMPDVVTFYRWLKTQEEFRKLYQLARDLQAELDIDEIIDIADNANGDIDEIEFTTKFGTENKPVFNRAKLERDKIRIDARKHRAAVLSPHKFGMRIRQEQTPLNPEQDQNALDLTQEAKIEAVKKIWRMAEAAQVADGPAPE